jgi:adenylosuccinate lyase
MTNQFDTYQSPYAWRYGSEDLRRLWSETYKRLTWRRLWLALAEVQAEYGIVNSVQVEDLRRHVEEIDIPRALQIEAEIHHDLMAEIKTYAEQCPVGGGVIHLGATSMDIVDNADALRVKASLGHLRTALAEVILPLLELVKTEADTPIMAMTHIQPAEPSTLGYRLAAYAQDLLSDWDQLAQLDANYRAKGFKGAVGTGASYAELLPPGKFSEFESRLSARLGIGFYPVTTQTYPRKQDLHLISALASLAASLYKFAFDLRILQTPAIGELAEPFREKQVGSSAMPFKRNPVNAEKLNSIGRMLAQMPRIAWDNAAHSLLERTLDDSANRRTTLPESFLIADEMLSTTRRILSGLVIDRDAIAANLHRYAPFAATERILLAAVQHGADRQNIHEVLRQHALQAWQTIRSGQEKANPLQEILSTDPEITRYLTPDQVRGLMDMRAHTGIAAQRAKEIASEAEPIRQWLASR